MAEQMEAQQQQVFAYHYTSRDRLWYVLTEGIRPGAEVWRGERLPFVMASLDPYVVEAGRVYVKFELAKVTAPWRAVNESWIEIGGTVPVEAIVGVAVPPTNMELLSAIVNGGNVDALYEYVSVERALAAMEIG